MKYKTLLDEKIICILKHINMYWRLLKKKIYAMSFTEE